VSLTSEVQPLLDAVNIAFGRENGGVTISILFDVLEAVGDLSTQHLATDAAIAGRLDARAEGAETEEGALGVPMERRVVAVCEAERLAQEVSRRIQEPVATVRRTIEMLSLGPRQSSGHRRTDRPSRFGRERSLVVRPLILQDAEIRTLYWTPLSCRNAIEAWIIRMRHGRLEARSKGLRSALSRYQNWVNDQVAQRVEILFRMDLRLRARKVDRLPGDRTGALGDVDVLVVAPSLGVIVLVEVKANAPALTRHELVRELSRLRIGAGTKKRSDADRVLAREAHARRHVVELLAEIGLEHGGEHWKVCSVFVYEHEILARHVASTVPVYSVYDIVEHEDRVAWVASVARHSQDYYDDP
jgi:hypothetical protein